PRRIIVPARQNIRRAAIAAAVMTLLQPAVLHAIDRNWGDSAGGYFSDPSNWTGGVVPGTADRAVFNLATTYTVTFDVNPVNDRLRVNNDGVTFNLTNHSYTLTNTSSTSVSVGGSGNIHGQPAAHGALRLLGNGTFSSV